MEAAEKAITAATAIVVGGNASREAGVMAGGSGSCSAGGGARAGGIPSRPAGGARAGKAAQVGGKAGGSRGGRTGGGGGGKRQAVGAGAKPSASRLSVPPHWGDAQPDALWANGLKQEHVGTMDHSLCAHPSGQQVRYGESGHGHMVMNGQTVNGRHAGMSGHGGMQEMNGHGGMQPMGMMQMHGHGHGGMMAGHGQLITGAAAMMSEDAGSYHGAGAGGADGLGSHAHHLGMVDSLEVGIGAGVGIEGGGRAGELSRAGAMKSAVGSSLHHHHHPAAPSPSPPRVTWGAWDTGHGSGGGSRDIPGGGMHGISFESDLSFSELSNGMGDVAVLGEPSMAGGLGVSSLHGGCSLDAPLAAGNELALLLDEPGGTGELGLGCVGMEGEV